VYQACKNRKDCEVEVVIAPIFRAVKYPNGEIKSDVIYEDFLTPMGIQHTPFKDYDIKKDLPDITFTSQPYESVTPEQFWAENIVPYTRLVYLPYFTSTGIYSNNGKMAQCQMPIHELAWRIICQSEDVKAEYSKYMVLKGANIIADGLPKWDWVVNMKNREIEFPEEWEKIRGKKIILRNYHYNFSNPADFIKGLYEKIEEHNGTDIGYLCRFHPMVETMFKVYYPNLKKQWEEVKHAIDISKNVVIDRNISYDYSFKFSDMLVTNRGTSLISQYLLTNKPIIVFYWGCLEEAKKLEESNEYFIKGTQLYASNDAEDYKILCNKLFSGEDFEYEKRMELVKRKLPKADGNIGERLVDRLINEIMVEDNVK